MKRNYLIGLVIGLCVTIFLGFFVITGNGVLETNNKINVVAGENFWGNIVSQIGGHDIVVTSIITNPNTDPHLYESDANDALLVSQAKLVIENGLGYDDFLDKLLSASNNHNRTVIKVSSLLGISASDANPHIWWISFFFFFFSKLEANMKTFNQSLTPIIDTINTI